MITRFVKFAIQILAPKHIDGLWPVESGTNESKEEKEERENTMRSMKKQRDAFKDYSSDLIVEVENRIQELNDLKSSAGSTAQNAS